jgi:hypothetical protein
MGRNHMGHREAQALGSWGINFSEWDGDFISGDEIYSASGFESS